MKKHLQKLLLCLTVALALLNYDICNAQCIWKRIVNDGYEVPGVVPHLIPNTTVHNTPQSFAVHTGATSLYMNFLNTLPANTLVYERPFAVCANVPIKLSAWVATSFSGVQCNIRFEIIDNGNIVDSISILADYAPLWSHYQSATISPMSSTLTLRLYTNIGGSPGGNDLSMDDLQVEQCSPVNLGNDTTICNTQSIMLNAGNGFSSYVWSNGATTSSITASTTLSGTTIANYYVSAIDSNGCTFGDTIRITFINCTGVIKVDDGVFYISPNPATDFIAIKSLEKNYTVRLYNVVGEKIQEFNNLSKIYVGNLPKGCYFLKIETLNMQAHYTKFLVE